MRTPRKSSEADIYHVVARGVGKHVIFEDDVDRQCFLDMLFEKVMEEKGAILAWCLMDNHFHVLIQLEMTLLSKVMKQVLSKYAIHFNSRHGRSGHLFQDRFRSEPIDSNEYLLTVIRYIHANPMHAGMTTNYDYPWSSYNNYVTGVGQCATEFVIEVFGGIDQFISFHTESNTDECLELPSPKNMLSDEEARNRAVSALGSTSLDEVGALDKKRRNLLLKALRQQGLTVRQIQRFTGIGRGIIEYAIKQ